MRDPIKQLLQRYAIYLNRSAEMFGYKSAEQVMAEGAKNNVAATNIYYHPEPFYSQLVAQGGFIPMILYNESIYDGFVTSQGLSQKLTQWEEMKQTLKAMVDDPSNFDRGFMVWKGKDPAFAGLTEDQLKLLYCAEKFERRYFTYEAHAPLVDTIGTVSLEKKLKGDCDTLSYVMGGLLADARLPDGTPVFDPRAIQFDHPEGHMRMRIKTSGTEDILFEATLDRNQAMGVNSYNGKALLTTDGELKGRYSMAQAIGKQVVSDFRKMEDNAAIDASSLAMLRSFIQINTPESWMKNRFISLKTTLGTCEQNIAQSGYEKLRREVDDLIVNYYNNQQPLPDGAFEAAFAQAKSFKKEWNTRAEDFTADDYKSVAYAFDQLAPKLETILLTLNKINPAKYAQMETAYQQADAIASQLPAPASSPAQPAQPTATSKSAPQR